MVTTVPEAVTVENWRIKQFTQLGFNEEQIAIMLLDQVDYHDMAKLLENGCDKETALLILID